MPTSFGFTPITLEAYVALHLKSNPKESAADFSQRLRASINAAKTGALCQCGDPIWAIGSTLTGDTCFTCLTGEATPCDDYEIDEVLAMHPRN